MLLSLLSKRLLDVDARDAYGFTVRPQHLQRYREYADIYKKEEEERLQKWNWFVKQQEEPIVTQPSGEVNVASVKPEVTEQLSHPVQELNEGDTLCKGDSGVDIHKETDAEKLVPTAVIRTKSHEVQKWVPVRRSLNHIETLMSSRVQKRKDMRGEQINTSDNHLPSIEEGKNSGEDFEQACEEVSDNSMDDNSHSADEHSELVDEGCVETLFPSKEELEFLVQGGVPRDLRGEVWQAFVGVRTRRIEKYYQGLLDPECIDGDEEHDKSESGEDGKRLNESRVDVPEKLRKQIEKDLPRTFPGHPALDEHGRNALRRLLVAYARHNPSVGYCQAMNFFAGLLLLMMPEENAFWALVGIIDDYFDGYYSQEMIESQVDQLVFEELVRERFPKLVNHLDYLGVQVTWISGAWFLSIFVNMLPWESVLRVWDVLLFEGNRVMLFRTALALLELYGPAIVTTKDAADCCSLLQSLAGSTFDSSQLVLTACMGFLTVTEDRLQELREKHRASVVEVVEERSKGARVWKDPKGLATKLYSFKHNPEPLVKEQKLEEDSGSNLENHSAELDKMLSGLDIDSELNFLPDIQDQFETNNVMNNPYDPMEELCIC
ncbi:OLC1v1034688C2 [Oldenlandia corymbosa var. corymbosa]|uniref:OLC1v1034688C2 n=1 Tax=Oldenlandia corymbosa var. corymbosa TaxID=529605 RepID=A0AAV1CRX9_OLDCO|nr:OLC1v1034688C2 [Oldenlandia corymbosa var. corymbosa]